MRLSSRVLRRAVQMTDVLALDVRQKIQAIGTEVYAPLSLALCRAQVHSSRSMSIRLTSAMSFPFLRGAPSLDWVSPSILPRMRFRLCPVMT